MGPLWRSFFLPASFFSGCSIFSPKTCVFSKLGSLYPHWDTWVCICPSVLELLCQSVITCPGWTLPSSWRSCESMDGWLGERGLLSGVKGINFSMQMLRSKNPCQHECWIMAMMLMNAAHSCSGSIIHVFRMYFKLRKLMWRCQHFFFFFNFAERQLFPGSNGSDVKYRLILPGLFLY